MNKHSTDEGGPLRVIGLLTVAVGAVAVLAGIVLALKSIPDIRRYLKIRSM